MPDFYKTILVNTVICPENNLLKYDSIKKDNVFKDLQYMISLRDDSFDGLQESVEYSQNYIRDYEYSLFKSRLVGLKLIQKSSITIPYFASSINDSLNIGIKNLRENRIEDISVPTGPCTPGATKVFITVDGKFYPCEKVCENNVLSIGDLNHGFNFENIELLMNVNTLTPEKCKKCWAFQLCNICVRSCYKDGKISAEERSKHCESAKLTAEQLIVTKIQNYEVKKYLKKFL